jgi:hypothetical protein
MWARLSKAAREVDSIDDAVAGSGRSARDDGSDDRLHPTDNGHGLAIGSDRAPIGGPSIDVHQNRRWRDPNRRERSEE